MLRTHSAGDTDPAATRGKRIARWDNLRFMLLLLVILGHLLQRITEQAPGTREVNMWLVSIYSFHMPAFFMLSGMMSRHAVSKDSFPSRRVFCFAAGGLIAGIGQAFAYSIARDGAILFNVVRNSDISWFMVAVTFHTVVSWLFRDVAKWRLLLVSLAFGTFIGCDPNAGNLFALTLTMTNWPFFVFGTMLDPDALDCVLTRWRWTPLVGAAWLVGLVVANTHSGNWALSAYFWQALPYEEPVLRSVVMRLVAFSISLGGCFAICAVALPIRIPLVTVMGRRTMAPYATHFTLIMSLNYLGFFKRIVESYGVQASVFLFMAGAVALMLALSSRPVWFAVASLTGEGYGTGIDDGGGYVDWRRCRPSRTRRKLIDGG